MPTDAELVELEARRAELREQYLLPAGGTADDARTRASTTRR